MSISAHTRAVIAKANRGDDLTDDELGHLYCEAPTVLHERDGFENMLRLIASDGTPESELRHIARRALGQ